MRAIEFLNEAQELAEIERLRPDDYEGGKDSLGDETFGKQIKKLPGGSGLLYSTNNNRWGGIEIKLWDPNGKDFAHQTRTTPGQLVGRLTVRNDEYFPLKNAVQVDTITIDEDYRGLGLAKALYGIVLTILKRPLLAGSGQTPGGRKNWVSLASIPGVEMKGYVTFDRDELDASGRKTLFRDPKDAAQNIDIVMGQLGGQYIGTSKLGEVYFAFDVKPNTTGQELEAYIDTKLSKVYDNRSEIGLYAIWTGQ